uniref:Uncharacterized protein n=1 Tax=viral metagenome TaxID=1070528 RepID=A0A6M3L873_9ZZZZ
MTEEEKIVVGKIVYIASDKRHRVLLQDENDWLEEKMKEIRRLAKSLPYIKYKVNQ